jgi:hypothetical protein
MTGPSFASFTVSVGLFEPGRSVAAAPFLRHIHTYDCIRIHGFRSLSFALTRLLIVILMFPLYAIIALNDWFYDGSYWLIRVLTGPRTPRLNAGFALAGELIHQSASPA